jgi:hypothetical protein
VLTRELRDLLTVPVTKSPLSCRALGRHLVEGMVQSSGWKEGSPPVERTCVVIPHRAGDAETCCRWHQIRTECAGSRYRHRRACASRPGTGDEVARTCQRRTAPDRRQTRRAPCASPTPHPRRPFPFCWPRQCATRSASAVFTATRNAAVTCSPGLSRIPTCGGSGIGVDASPTGMTVVPLKTFASQPG